MNETALTLRPNDPAALAAFVARHPKDWWRHTWPTYAQYRIIDSALGSWCASSGMSEGDFATYLERLLTTEYVKAPGGGIMAPETPGTGETGLIDLDRGHSLMGQFSALAAERPKELPAPAFGSLPAPSVEVDDSTAIEIEWREWTEADAKAGPLAGQEALIDLESVEPAPARCDLFDPAIVREYERLTAEAGEAHDAGFHTIGAELDAKAAALMGELNRPAKVHLL